MLVVRRLVPVELIVVVVVPPRVAYKRPVIPPVTQKADPSTEVAPRKSLALNAFRPVVVLMAASTSTRPTTRAIVADEEVAMPAVPVAASNPGTIRNRPSADRVISPSVWAVP